MSGSRFSAITVWDDLKRVHHDWKILDPRRRDTNSRFRIFNSRFLTTWSPLPLCKPQKLTNDSDIGNRNEKWTSSMKPQKETRLLRNMFGPPVDAVRDELLSSFSDRRISNPGSFPISRFLISKLIVSMPGGSPLKQCVNMPSQDC